MDGGLLVADQDVANLVLLEQGIVERQDGPTRIAENYVHALVDQRLDHHLRARQGLRVGGCGGLRRRGVHRMLLGRPSPFYLKLTLGRFPTGQPPGRRTLIGWPGRVNARTRRQVFAISASARTSASALSPSSPTAVSSGS